MRVICAATLAILLFAGSICDARCRCNHPRLFSGRCRMRVAPADSTMNSPFPARLPRTSHNTASAPMADFLSSDEDSVTLVPVAAYDPFAVQPIGMKVWDCLHAEGIMPFMSSRSYETDIAVHPADARKARELIDALRQEEDLDIAVLDEDGQTVLPGKVHRPQ